MYIHLYICMYMCIYIYVYVYTHTHAYMQTYVPAAARCLTAHARSSTGTISQKSSLHVRQIAHLAMS